MRKTIYNSNQENAKDKAFSIHQEIYDEYRRIYKKNPPEMFVGIQTIAKKQSIDNWVLTVDGSPEEVDKIEKIGKVIEDRENKKQ